MAEPSLDLKYEVDISTTKTHTWDTPRGWLRVVTKTSGADNLPEISNVELSLVQGGAIFQVDGVDDLAALRRMCQVTAAALDPDQLANLDTGHGLDFDSAAFRSDPPSTPANQRVRLAEHHLLALLWGDDEWASPLDPETWTCPDEVRKAADYMVAYGLLMPRDKVYHMTVEGRRLLQHGGDLLDLSKIEKAKTVMQPKKKSRRGS